jgi:hypothetical protein
VALLPGSPAIDAGNPAPESDLFPQPPPTLIPCPTTDQRDAPRPDVAGTRCDVGAFEFQQQPPLPLNVQAVTGSFTSSGPGVAPGARPPTCVVTPKSPRVTVASARMASAARTTKRKKPGLLAVEVKCDQGAVLTLTANLTDRAKVKAGHRPKSKTFHLGPIMATVSGGLPKTLTLKLPKGALADLKRKHRESVTLKLLARNPNGSSQTTATIAALKATH